MDHSPNTTKSSQKLQRNNFLLQWIASLPTFTEPGIRPTNEHFKDGVMTSRILKNVIDPVYFNDLNDSPTKSTQLVFVVDKMKKYLTTQIGHSLPSNLFPNIGKIIGSGDIGEINRLLQCILGCAVNSQRKESFVTGIMQMENNVQFDLMEAIQELLKEEEAMSIIPDTEDLRGSPKSQIAALHDTVEQLQQTNHELKVKLSEISEEKVALMTENERLTSQLQAQLNDPESIHVSLKHQEESRREADLLRDENYRLETIIDDLKIKLQVLEKQVIDSQTKIASCNSLQEELIRLKDETDSLREAAAKVNQYEISIQQYKKKLESVDILKRSIKDLEEKNEELHRTNIHLEDEVKKTQSLRNQVEDIKKKLIETQQSLSQENQKVRRLEHDNRLLREKCDNSQSLAERLQEENRQMSNQVEEMKLNTNNATNDIAGGIHGDTVTSMDLLPMQFKQKLTRLEVENTELKRKLKQKFDAELACTDEGSRVLVEELRKREAVLDEELLIKTQELVDLKTGYDEKIRALEAQLISREEDLKKKENQYKKCIEKAKNVVLQLEPTSASASSSGLDSNSKSTDAEMEKARAVREMEEKLLASAFYNYGLQMHRNAVESRNVTALQRQRNLVSSSSRRKSDISHTLPSH